jgi:hypothetical protein
VRRFAQFLFSAADMGIVMRHRSLLPPLLYGSQPAYPLTEASGIPFLLADIVITIGSDRTGFAVGGYQLLGLCGISGIGPWLPLAKSDTGAHQRSAASFAG